MNIIELISDPIYFEEAARRLGFASSIIVEKDFWVVWLLNQLFSDPQVSTSLVFKGGTSLSKVYNIINRFSEDIDLTVDRSKLGIETSIDTINHLGSKRRKKFFEDSDKKLKHYIDCLIKELQIKFTELPELVNKTWRLYTDEDYPHVIYFEYPNQNQNLFNRYLKPHIVLEFGIRGAIFPTQRRIIKPYVAEIFTNLEHNMISDINVLCAERTYWEKATLLYAIYEQPSEKIIKPTLARHFYDLVLMQENEIGITALNRIDLLKDVIKQKQVLFKNSWLNYNDILLKGIHLIPTGDKLKIIKNDYKNMNEMFFNEPPKFEYILEKLKEIEESINSKIL